MGPRRGNEAGPDMLQCKHATHSASHMPDLEGPLTHIFLDIDGVLRLDDVAPRRLEPACVANLQTALGPVPEAQIVVSSTWRHELQLDGLRRLFPDALARRIEGITPLVAATPFARFAEIHAYCLRKGIADDSWLAIDRDAKQFPPGAPLLEVSSADGFDTGCIARMWSMISTD